MSRCFRLLPVVAALALCPAAAANSIDQSVIGPVTVTVGGGFNLVHAQTFTAGLNGTLAGVSLSLTVVGGPLTLAITTTVPCTPTCIGVLPAFGVPGTALTSTTLNPGTYTLSNLITFPQAIASVAGTTYAILLISSNTYSWDYGGLSSNPPNYQNGQALQGQLVCSGFPAPTCNVVWASIIGGTPSGFLFQTHVNVTPAPVPEPGTLLLIGSGALAVLLRRRRLTAGANQ